METSDIAQVIGGVFDDYRTLTPVDYENDGYLFKTSDNELILADSLIDGEFDIERLTHYVEIAEELNREYFCKINIYIVCAETVKVTVKEFPVSSEADFCIKVHQPQNTIQSALQHLKQKVENGESLTSQEIEMVQMLPMYCNDEDRHRVRVECLEILNKVLK